jgi:outer membrane protein OmpA-like peptidoglycan-associated protein
MSSNPSDDLKLSKRASLNYNVTENFLMGFSYAHAEVYGDNEIAFYNGEFNQINAHTRLNILKLRPDLTVYAKLGIGIVSYKSDRTFIGEEEVYLTSKGEALNTNQALGLSYQYNENWSIVAEGRLDRIASDDFDSWDDGSGTDKLFNVSVGVRYYHKPFKNRCSSGPVDASVIPTPVCEMPDSLLNDQEEKIAELKKDFETLQMSLSILQETLKQQEATDFDRAVAVTMEIRRLFFAPGSSNLPITYQPSLQDLSAALNKYPNWKVAIVGYADSDADEAFNQALSERRAEAVKAELVKMGINRDRIETKGMGENSPFESNDTSDGKTLNRRVEVHLNK